MIPPCPFCHCWLLAAPGVSLPQGLNQQIIFFWFGALAELRPETAWAWAWAGTAPALSWQKPNCLTSFTQPKTQRPALLWLWTKPSFKPVGGWCKDAAWIQSLGSKGMKCLQEISWVWLILFLMAPSLLQITLLLDGCGFNSYSF